MTKVGLVGHVSRLTPGTSGLQGSKVRGSHDVQEDQGALIAS